MWFHLDTADFTLRSVGVAQSASPEGPFTFLHCFQPDGDPSLDMTLFQDTDGTAYFVRSDNNKFAAVSRLTEDYLNTTSDGVCSKGYVFPPPCCPTACRPASGIRGAATTSC